MSGAEPPRPEAFSRPMVTFAKNLQFIGGQRVEFAGATGAIERAKRGTVVHTG